MSTPREKLLAQFRELVVERLDRIGRFLMRLEGQADAEAGKAALRDLHGLKGEARMMGFQDINALVHQMEEVVRSAQPGDYLLDPASTDALLVASDAVSVLAGASASASPPDVARLLEWLQQRADAERVANGGVSSADKTSASGVRPVPPASAPLPVPSPPIQSSPPVPAAAGSAPAMFPPPQASAPTAQRVTVERSEGGVRITQQGLEVLTAAVTQSLTRNRRRERVSQQWLSLTRELAVLHRLAEDMGAVGDLAVRLGKSKDLAAELHRESKLLLNEEVRDLTQMSEEIQAARMVPLGLLFEQYPRMVRDLARDLGKEVELTVEGEDTRVDRTVLEALREPLLHLVRNAIDHGLETRDERTDAGKNPRGHLSLVARREGERLLLKVEDDGRGLDPELLKQVALRKGVIDETQASRLSDAAAMDLIFLPGFSSKDSVSDVSGRGVGLDVVRVRMLGLGGEVTVSSHVGSGATFELLMPVSLTVAPLLFVEMSGERLCLQASSVLSALRVEHEQIRELAGRPALRVEEQVLPFAAMASILGGAGERTALEGELVLLLQGRGQKAAVAVDRVLEERVQAVLPLKGVLSRFSHLSGATPLADGSLALLLSAAHLVSTAHGREGRLTGLLTAVAQVKKRRILVVDDSPLTRELLVSLLEAVGYEVLSASDGQHALEKLHEQSVDIVVTDLEMPRVDGLELTRRLKAHATLRALPVVIVTTRGSETDRKRGMEAGADGYVTKGDLVRQDLVDVVSRLLA